MIRKIVLLVSFCVCTAVSALARTDTVKLQWPNPPLTSSHNINGTFAEYRNTLSANHFHNGVDIGEPDNNPVYPCIDGIVYTLSTSSGSNNYIRIKSNVGGVWKHISYVHVNPSPALSPGMSVTAGVTVLGTIYPGMGHVHLTERELVSSENSSGVEINGIRNGGGLTPYDDPYTPVINRPTLEFRQYETGAAIPGSTLYGNVDIIIRVDERNGPGNPGSTQTNNGTYMLGYRILAADSVTVAYEPPDNGLRYRFDRKPADADVDIAFLAAPVSTTSSHHYRVTAGSGASAVNSTLRVPRNAFNTELLPEGLYVLEIFAEDTRGNTDRDLFPISITRKDLVPPTRPTLRSVLVDDTTGGLTVSWYPVSDPDLNGYRLYYRYGTDWRLAASETVLTKTSTSISFSSVTEFQSVLDPGNPNLVSFKLTSVDTVTPPNESADGDVYFGAYEWYSVADCGGPDLGCPPMPPVLIVDGFDRYGGSGSWSQPTHEFVSQMGMHFSEFTPVSSAANEAVIDGSVHLQDYSAVFWILGDESTVDNTLTSTEQSKLRQFLEGGGKLFISGSEIGWDLGRSHTASESGDLSFYNNYLKATYAYDGDSNMKTATGTSGGMLEGYTFTFGQTYAEDYPDDIRPANGSEAVLAYNVSPRIAGIVYSGIFGSGSIPGKLVYLSFPFETISSEVQRQTLLEKVRMFFGLINSVEELDRRVLPTTLSLSPNYPNPFNPSTTFELDVPRQERVTFRIFDLLGREIATLMDEVRGTGRYRVTWNASFHPSGTYIARVQAGSTILSRKILLVK